MRFEIGKREALPLVAAIAVSIAATATVVTGLREAGRADIERRQQMRLVLGTTRLAGILGKVEIAQRDYVLTGDKTRLGSYFAAQRELPELFTELRQYRTPIPELARLEELARGKMAHTSQVLATFDAGETASAASAVVSRRGSMDELRSRVLNGQRAWLAQAEALGRRFEHFSALSRNVTIGGTIGTALLMMIAAWQFNRRAARAREALARIHSGEERYQMLAARLQRIREEESGSLARRVHDELGQSLTAIRFDLNALARRLDGRDDEMRRQVGDAITMADKAVQTVRTIAQELRPGVLDQLGLSAALEWLAAEFRTRYGLRVLVEAPDSVDAGKDQQLALFRVAQEAFTNIARHARARTVQLDLAVSLERVEMTVRDDGDGIPEEVLERGRSFGLLSMQERARLAGGVCEIASSPGGGTTVHVALPVPAQPPYAVAAAAKLSDGDRVENAQARAGGR